MSVAQKIICPSRWHTTCQATQLVKFTTHTNRLHITSRQKARPDPDAPVAAECALQVLIEPLSFASGTLCILRICLEILGSLFLRLVPIALRRRKSENQLLRSFYRSWLTCRVYTTSSERASSKELAIPQTKTVGVIHINSSITTATARASQLTLSIKRQSPTISAASDISRRTMNIELECSRRCE